MHILIDLLDFVPVLPKLTRAVCAFLFRTFAVLVYSTLSLSYLSLLALCGLFFPVRSLFWSPHDSFPLCVGNVASVAFPIPSSERCPFLHGYNSTGTSR